MCSKSLQGIDVSDIKGLSKERVLSRRLLFWVSKEEQSSKKCF